MSETYIQWRRRMEHEMGYQGVTFTVEERNGKVTGASVTNGVAQFFWPPQLNPIKQEKE